MLKKYRPILISVENKYDKNEILTKVKILIIQAQRWNDLPKEYVNQKPSIWLEFNYTKDQDCLVFNVDNLGPLKREIYVGDIIDINDFQEYLNILEQASLNLSYFRQKEFRAFPRYTNLYIF